ncbi:hypothetical protein FHETE_2410 [Fusarium heterosporum]|uniref:Uncharacterized protein n=1 Tax=Fusarium heterosporum TaxID=42747 RepID=A0A8H5TUF1_FUSHE|nr:hypothetical protein FHETE_2410 [Fusarium heterosporum]
MAASYLSFFLTLLSLGHIVSAGNFINPPPSDSVIGNPVYQLGDRLKITWQAAAEFTDLTMWQTDTGQRYNLQSNSKSKEYEWIVSYQGIDPANGTSFSFWMFKTGDTGSLFSSHTFNITDPSTLTTSAPTSVQTTSPKTRTKTSSETTTTTDAAAASSTTAEGPAKSGLSTGAVAGVSLGAVVGGLLLAGTGFMLWRRKKRSTPTVDPSLAEVKNVYTPVEAPHNNVMHQGPWEMGGSTHFVHELPVERGHRI